MPVSYGSIHLYGDLPRRLWCQIRWPRSNHVEKEIATFDIVLADEGGAVIAEIKEFALRRLVSTALLAGEAAEREPVTISSDAGVRAFAAMVDGPPLSRILAVPSGLRLDEPMPAASPARASAAAADSDGEPRDEVEQRLAQWWQELLGVEHVSIHQDFFDLGGHSLVALRLFTKIKNQFGQDLGLATLFEARTIEELANLIRKPQEQKAPVSVVGIRTGGSKPALFLIHGVYGNVVKFQTLVQHLSPDQPVYGIQSQAFDKTGPALMRMEDLARHYLQGMRKHQPEGPYHFAGFSFGGIVAFEMARQLHAMGEHAGFVGLIDTWHPNRVHELNAKQTMSQKLARRIEWLRDHLREISGPGRGEYLKRRLNMRFKRIVYTIYDAAGKPVPRSLENVGDINSFAAIHYKPGVYPGRIDIFRAEKAWGDQRLGHLLGWDGLAESIEVHEIPGGHLDIFASGVIEVVAREIEACLKRATSEYDAQHEPAQAADTASVTGE